MHAIALGIAGAAIMPIAAYVKEETDWQLAHSEVAVDPITSDPNVVTDPYATAI